MTPKLILSVLLFTIAGFLPRAPQSITIVGMDYAFQVPEHIRAGETLFTFENRGTVRHEMSLVMLKAGFPADSVLAAIVAGSPRRNFVDGQGALIIARPGDPPGPRLWLDLEGGRSYLVLCTLRDTADAPPHVRMGMAAKFVVE